MSAYNTDQKVSRTQLDVMPVPPSIGRWHNPIAFGEFVNEVENQLDRVGLVINKEEHLVGHEGMRYFGLMEVAPKEGQLITSDEWKVLMGLCGSHDQSVGRKIALGDYVMVCSNLCFRGDIYTSSTRQTLNIWNRLPGMLYNAVSRIPQMAELEDQRIEKFKNTVLSTPQAMDALASIFMDKGLSSAQLGRSIHEWHEPTFPEFDGHTAWTLENAITQAVKPTGGNGNMLTVMNRTQQASEYLTTLVYN